MMKSRKQPVIIDAPTSVAIAVAAPRRQMGDDMRLFAMTFVAGFLFTSLFIA